jgi:hypothetical protein
VPHLVEGFFDVIESCDGAMSHMDYVACVLNKSSDGVCCRAFFSAACLVVVDLSLFSSVYDSFHGFCLRSVRESLVCSFWDYYDLCCGFG